MKVHQNRKKNLIISYKNLTEELKKLFKEAYPEGYKDYLQKTIKPNGEPIFVVPLETEDTNYMIKFDVKIDTTLVDDELDKDPYEDEAGQDDGEYAPLSEAIDKEEGNNTIRTLQHGAYEDTFDVKDDKKSFELATADMEEAFGDTSDGSEDDLDRYLDGEEDDEEGDEDDEMEPDDDELLDIESMLIEADSGKGLLREENPPDEEPRGRKKSTAAAKKSTAKADKPAKKSEPVAKTAKTTKVSKPAKAPKPAAPKPAPVKAAKPAPVKAAKPAAAKAPKASTPKPAGKKK